MNYQKHYNLLIERARNRILEGYQEKHHIVPRCMGGTNDPENIVALTAEEHYVAHQLLVKMYPNNHGLAYSLIRMSAIDPKSLFVVGRSNKTYGWVRRKFAQIHSEYIKENPSSSQFKKGHIPWNTGIGTSGMEGKKHSKETKLQMRNAALGKLKGPMTQEHKDKIRMRAIGRKQSSQTCKLKSQIAKKLPKVKCNHCEVFGKKSIMTRWHFDNCKKLKETV